MDLFYLDCYNFFVVPKIVDKIGLYFNRIEGQNQLAIGAWKVE